MSQQTKKHKYICKRSSDFQIISRMRDNTTPMSLENINAFKNILKELKHKHRLTIIKIIYGRYKKESDSTLNCLKYFLKLSIGTLTGYRKQSINATSFFSKEDGTVEVYAKVNRKKELLNIKRLLTIFFRTRIELTYRVVKALL